MNTRTIGALGAALLSALAGCDAAQTSSLQEPAGQGVAVAIAPPAAEVPAGGTVGFAATVTGTAATTVTWSVAEASGCGSVSTSGVYTAPAAAGTCHVVVTSAADPTKGATAIVTVTAPPPPPPAVTVSVSPGSVSLSGCRTRTFAATVTGATDTSVTWSVQEGAAGGTITSGGVYTAPSTPGVYHVIATSRADPTKASSAAVTVADEVVSVAVSPSSITVPSGGSATFSATVTTTCGTFTAMRTVLANGTVVPN
jgi:hypothetical protein